MEDTHDQNRQERIDAEFAARVDCDANNAPNEDASVENTPKGQDEEIDFQRNDQFDYDTAASDDEETVESSQPSSNPAALTNQATKPITNTSRTTAPIAIAACVPPTAGIDMTTLFVMLKKELQDQVDKLSKNIEKKEMANEIKQTADMANIQAIVDRIQEKRANTPQPPLKLPLVTVPIWPSYAVKTTTVTFHTPTLAIISSILSGFLKHFTQLNLSKHLTWRIAGILILNEYAPTFADYLLPYNYAIGVNGGIDLIIKTIQLATDKYIIDLENNAKLPTRALVSLDIKNMFNAVSRERLREIISEKFPTLEAYADLIYDGAGETFVRLENGEWTVIPVTEGFRKVARPHLSLRR
jgi:hypothetical protein